MQALTQVAEAFEASRAGFERDRERDLTGLALAVARRIVLREVTADPAIVRSLVTRALELLPLDRSFEVRLNPEDLGVLGTDLEGAVPPGIAPMIQWAGDPALERGSFVIESPLRVVDGRSDVALRALYDRLGDA